MMREDYLVALLPLVDKRCSAAIERCNYPSARMLLGQVSGLSGDNRHTVNRPDPLLAGRGLPYNEQQSRVWQRRTPNKS